MNLFASDAVKKALAILLVISGGLATHLPDGLVKTISTYIALILGAGGLVSGGVTSAQPPGVIGRVVSGSPEIDPPHFRVS
jgi:hypothetical protein